MIKQWPIFILLLALISCGTEQPPNPFDIGTGEPVDTANLTGFAALHEKFLEPRCANPACHDGTFEPDFRTVEGSYNTLVYHPVVKNDENETFEYRVVPGDVNQSWLINRLMTANDTLGRMPLYAEPLTWDEVKEFSDWIMAGAPDARGNLPIEPNEVPRFEWYVAFSGDMDWNNTRIDNNRHAWEFPLPAAVDDTVRLVFRMNDDMTEPSSFPNVKVWLSDNEDYDNAVSYNANYLTGSFWNLMFPPNTFNMGDTNYFYLEFTDGTHNVMAPEFDSPWWYKDHCSFYIE
ncbi:MAG TPA: hypothetical protein DCG83_01100 [Cryomorphaceae bacterium]|nr:hypothetical protein [Cryomorphaceae bacterium]